MIVRFSPEALAAIREKRDWWKSRRDKAPERFADELRQLVAQLRVGPTEGATNYTTHRGQRVWRRLMPKIRLHAYFCVDRAAGVVEVITVWNAQGGDQPDFSS